MDLIAYALTADYDGTVEIDGQEVRRFTGGVIATESGDIHLLDLLTDGDDDLIVCWEQDAELVERLDVLPAFKRVGVPKEPAVVVTPYDRMSLDRLRAYAHAYQVKGAGSVSQTRLRRALIERAEQLHAAAKNREVAADASVAELLEHTEDDGQADDGEASQVDRAAADASRAADGDTSRGLDLAGSITTGADGTPDTTEGGAE